MIKSRIEESKLEIWGYQYINKIENRLEEDKNKIILQIESTPNKGDYIVEVIDKNLYKKGLYNYDSQL